MRNLFLISLLALCFNVFSQSYHYNNGQNIIPKNVLKMFPLGFINKAKIGYEYAVNENFTFGANVALYYMLFKGVTLGPTARIYFNGLAPHGFFLQLQAHYFNTQTEIVFKETINGVQYTSRYPRSASGGGGGFGLGYQFLLGAKKNLSIDLMGGFRFLPVPERAFYVRHIDPLGESEVDYSSIWYLTGPGSIFNCHFSLGYAF